MIPESVLQQSGRTRLHAALALVFLGVLFLALPTPSARAFTIDNHCPWPLAGSIRYQRDSVTILSFYLKPGEKKTYSRDTRATGYLVRAMLDIPERRNPVEDQVRVQSFTVYVRAECSRRGLSLKPDLADLPGGKEIEIRPPDYEGPTLAPPPID